MAKAKQFKILIVDDHPVVRQGLHLLIKNDDSLTICAEATTAAECISMSEEYAPDMVLSDISLPGTDGIELTKELRQINPSIPILVFSIHGEDLYAERALAAGANGYVMKQENPDVLLKAIHRVLDGDIFLSPKMTSRMLKQMSRSRSSAQQQAVTGIQKLSDRELEVFELIGNGLSTRKIADRLNLSIKTIETYRLHIKEKLDVQDASELTYQAVHWVQSEATNP